MATYTDEKNNDYVLLGQKKLRPSQTSTPMILLGGYFQPHPLVGHVPGVEKLTDEEKDKIEEAIREGIQNAYQLMTPDKQSTKSADDKSASTATKKPAIVFDQNLAACATRELKEEANLTGVTPQFLMEQSDFPDTNPDLHCINSSYLFDCGVRAQAPDTKRGSDIESLHWVKFSDIRVGAIDNKNKYFIGSTPLRQDHGPVLEKGARELIEKRIKTITDGLMTIDTLEKHIELLAKRNNETFAAIMGKKPDTHLGIAGQAYYKKLERIAAEYKKCFDNNKSFDLNVVKECLPTKQFAAVNAPDSLFYYPDNSSAVDLIAEHAATDSKVAAPLSPPPSPLPPRSPNTGTAADRFGFLTRPTSGGSSASATPPRTPPRSPSQPGRMVLPPPLPPLPSSAKNGSANATASATASTTAAAVTTTPASTTAATTTPTLAK